jgi:hypothetical protein
MPPLDLYPKKLRMFSVARGILLAVAGFLSVELLKADLEAGGSSDVDLGGNFRANE